MFESIARHYRLKLRPMLFGFLESHPGTNVHDAVAFLFENSQQDFSKRKAPRSVVIELALDLNMCDVILNLFLSFSPKPALCSDYELVLTGHSLGGGYATITYLLICHDFYAIHNPHRTRTLKSVSPAPHPMRSNPPLFSPPPTSIPHPQKKAIPERDGASAATTAKLTRSRSYSPTSFLSPYPNTSGQSSYGTASRKATSPSPRMSQLRRPYDSEQRSEDAEGARIEDEEADEEKEEAKEKEVCSLRDSLIASFIDIVDEEDVEGDNEDLLEGSGDSKLNSASGNRSVAKKSESASSLATVKGDKEASRTSDELAAESNNGGARITSKAISSPSLLSSAPIPGSASTPTPQPHSEQYPSSQCSISPSLLSSAPIPGSATTPALQHPSSQSSVTAPSNPVPFRRPSSEAVSHSPSPRLTGSPTSSLWTPILPLPDPLSCDRLRALYPGRYLCS